ncbi:MAG TPA: NHL repeat-containing protein [Candidatus Baltobacteraceae bacterium]|nr:NHL repeat-containing protein [Candidatus Baltobacteraceae bacterium]
MRFHIAWLAAAAALTLAGCTGGRTGLPNAASAFGREPAGASPTLYVADAWGKAVERVVSGTARKIGRDWYQPWGVACDAKGNVYVADNWANKIVRIASNGAMTEIKPGVFKGAAGVVADGHGNIYVASYVNGWTGGAIAKISSNGALTRLAKSLKMTEPRAIAIDDLGNLYVVDPHWTNIAKVAPNGKISRVGSGFYFPTGVAVDRRRNVYVVNGRGDLYKVTPRA